MLPDEVFVTRQLPSALRRRVLLRTSEAIPPALSRPDGCATAAAGHQSGTPPPHYHDVMADVAAHGFNTPSGAGIRREKVQLRRPPASSGEPRRVVNLDGLATALSDGQLAREISDANHDPDLAV